jgi:hypothetical protein
MRFNPLSEEQLQEQALAPEGNYRYRVVEAKEAVSKAGNEYISLLIKIQDEKGVEYGVFTNLALIKLLKHFCDVNGMQDQYMSGEITAKMCSGKNGGMVMIKTEAGKENPSGGMYPAKNVVKDYIVSPKGSMQCPMKPLPEVKNSFPDDDIPDFLA